MQYRYYLLMLAVSLFLYGCGQDYKTVEIDVPDSVKQGIVEAAPGGKYRFCALDESYPRNYDDLKKSTLFVCGEIENKLGQELIMASRDENNSFLFPLVRRYFINTNLLAGELSATEILTLTTDGGESISIPCVQSIYGQDHSFNDILGNCLQEMEGDKNSILLIEKKEKIDSNLMNGMVELKFK
ncbi:MAG: hypothetical protein RQ743_12195 [Bacteroidales bacterium]|nr:hypothetical protein [Bacteroidales bacterium]